MPRILSIEDDADFQQLISHALRPHGFELHYAFSGPEGLEKALSLAPDLVLLDMMLPGLNGVEVMRRLKKDKATRELPVIVLTAYAADANFMESEVQALGTVEYLRKPVPPETLLRAIRRLLDGRRSRPALAVWERGAFRLAPEGKSVWVGERMIAHLAPKRFELLFHLLQSKGEVPWQELVRKVWGADGTKNELEKTVSRLREDLGAESWRLGTTRRGYQLRSDP
jgi:two-component system, OmpR family, phosphate regulon response regulator PhoB